MSTSRLATTVATTGPPLATAITLDITLDILATPHITLDLDIPLGITQSPSTQFPLLSCLPTLATIPDMLTTLMQLMSDILTQDRYQLLLM